ncbi:protein transport protein bet1 [Collariella sp. IMI 366227]|nr:protein transport protein bet1 [Collariella sp. IMI 366227]
MASRFARDSRSDLFKGYTGGSSSRPVSASPGPSRQQQQQQPLGGGGSGYGYGGGQYSDAVLNELESQNDEQVEGILGKVKMLKDMTVAIGDEIRDSSALAEKMNDGFDKTRLRLGRTMNRMLVMAERTGVGWKVWLAFFAAVIFLFIYVWLF